jgi:hypothetical protein
LIWAELLERDTFSDKRTKTITRKLVPKNEGTFVVCSGEEKMKELFCLIEKEKIRGIFICLGVEKMKENFYLFRGEEKQNAY